MYLEDNEHLHGTWILKVALESPTQGCTGLEHFRSLQQCYIPMGHHAEELLSGIVYL